MQAIMPGHTQEGSALTALVNEVFRLNGSLQHEGDRLTRDLGLTCARWQVLSAVAQAEVDQTVAGLARMLGLTRQSVQRVADLLAEEGLVEFAPNPNHRRAKLVVLSERGIHAFEAASQRQIPWINDLASGLEAHEVSAAIKVLHHMREKIQLSAA